MTTPHSAHVYATLLLSDSYLPGALVLAHSLRDAHTTKQLAVLVTLDTVSADAVTQLKSVYDHVIPVPRIQNSRPANLHLMNRADLHSAFTKVNLWRQLQFSKIVYIDADVVAYRAPDELFALREHFAAAPDIGWPDLFNTGVMVLTPNMGDYYAMMAMAERGISFDGADQGLINMHFRNDAHRLSFAYNVTPSAHYQYIPAYRHFQSSINMVHFIGANKPWFAGRNAPAGSSPFDDMVGRWWAVYDRHYRKADPSSTVPTTSQWQPASHEAPTVPAAPAPAASVPPPVASSTFNQQVAQFASDHGIPEATAPQASEAPPPAHVETAPPAYNEPAPPAPAHEPAPAAAPAPPPQQTWDAQWQPPPADSKPEAIDLPSAHYPMSRDVAPFVAPQRYPSPPKDMWYEVPKEPPTPKEPPKPMFPWEGRQPPTTRTFVEEPREEPAPTEPEPPQPGETPSTPPSQTLQPAAPEPQEPAAPQPAPEPWSSFQLSNAWDQVPQIGRYVDSLQKHRRVRSIGPSSNAAEVVSSPQASSPGTRRRQGFKLTDFPSEVERPSLPVTPAPIGRSSFWGQDEDDKEAAADKSGTGGAPGQLPPAAGVPEQSDWDPEAQLQKLARQQHDHLLRKLSGDGDAAAQEGGEGGGTGRIIPNRDMPFGSEDAKSPTYITRQYANASGTGTGKSQDQESSGAGAAQSQSRSSGGSTRAKPPLSISFSPPAVDFSRSGVTQALPSGTEAGSLSQSQSEGLSEPVAESSATTVRDDTEDLTVEGLHKPEAGVSPEGVKGLESALE